MEQLETILPTILSVIKNWWWVILPFVLWRPFLFLWLWWRREGWWSKQRTILLEIKMPEEIIKPIKAMEQVFLGLWGTNFDPPDWWEKWVDGKDNMSYSFEIVGRNGEVHFYIRIPEAIRNGVESVIYSQYPDIEISVSEDYTKTIPKDIPNKEWDLWGSAFELLKSDAYPIKTYSKFFEEKPDSSKEEKRLDPLSPLVEGLGSIGPEEQMWIQICACPITAVEDDYIGRGKKIVGKLLKRPEVKKPMSILQEGAEGLAFGVSDKKEEKMEFSFPELTLSSGEREIVSGIDEKISKYAFTCFIRFIYIGKKEVFFKPQTKSVFAFFTQFCTANLNGIKPFPMTLTKIHKSWFLPLNSILPRRLYVRQRRLFRNYIKRLRPLYPLPGKTFVLNTEELATMFHFPGRMVAPAPSVSRIRYKKGEAPPGLPVE